MKRLIDDMNAEAMKLSWARWSKEIDAWCEEMCRPIPTEWHEKLDTDDDDTWVLCYVSNDNPLDRNHVKWVSSYLSDSSCPHRVMTDEPYWEGDNYKYATPVDLNIRYKGKE